MQQEMVQLARPSAAASYIEPEILKSTSRRSRGFSADAPRLEVYAFYLRDVVRRAAPHAQRRRGKALAAAGPLLGSSGNVYNILSNADFPYPSVTLSDGHSAKLDPANFATLRASAAARGSPRR